MTPDLQKEETKGPPQAHSYFLLFMYLFIYLQFPPFDGQGFQWPAPWKDPGTNQSTWSLLLMK